MKQLLRVALMTGLLAGPPFFAPAPAAGAECIGLIQVMPYCNGELLFSQAELDPRASAAGATLEVTPGGAAISLPAEQPEMLYRKVELSLRVPFRESGRVDADLAYYAAWPCEKPASILLPLTAQTGRADEVLEMWRSKAMMKPEDTSAAALYYARALETAELRYKRDPNSKHQYDLIACYLALRAFRKYLDISEAPIEMTPRLRKIAGWYRDLHSRVSLRGLEPIEKEGTAIAAERVALSALYRRKWNEILELSKVRPSKALEGIRRFKTAIEAEPETHKILADINLSHEEVLNSANSIAGRIGRDRLKDAQVKGMVEQQIEDSQRYLRARRPSGATAERIKSDSLHLKKSVELID